MKVGKFTLKPIEFEAVQVTRADDWPEIKKWIRKNGGTCKGEFAETIHRFKIANYARLYTGDIIFQVVLGDWIVRKEDGRFGLCKPAVFDKVYDTAKL